MSPEEIWNKILRRIYYNLVPNLLLCSLTGQTNLYLSFTGKIQNINRRNGKHSSTDEAKSFKRVAKNNIQSQFLIMRAKRGVHPPPSHRRPTPFPFSRDFNLYACHAALQYTRINNSNLFRSLWYKSVGKTRDPEKRRRSTPNKISTWFENRPKSWQYAFPVFSLLRFCRFPFDVWQFRSHFILLVKLLLVPTFHFLNKARFVDRVLL